MSTAINIMRVVFGIEILKDLASLWVRKTGISTATVGESLIRKKSLIA